MNAPGMDARGRSFVVAEGDAGRRLDALLVDRLGISRAEARRLLGAGAVAIDGRRVSFRAKGDLVRAGSQIALDPYTPRHALRILAEPAAALEVLAKGEGWVALDKPAGRAVHPLKAGETGTVLNAVAARHPEVQGVGEGGLRSGVVHRLDVETSGVLLVATEQAVWERLRSAFREHRVRKGYRAIVLGRPADEGRVALDLVVARHRPARVAVVARGASGARRARLAWRLLEPLDAAALVEVRPVTGFLHQVRATFAYLGHPVAGDPIYGPGPGLDPTGALRQLLHAARLDLDEIHVESADPGDLTATLERLGN